MVKAGNQSTNDISSDDIFLPLLLVLIISPSYSTPMKEMIDFDKLETLTYTKTS